MKFRENILLYLLLPLIILCIGASYMRFMITHDYLVAYEGECDPMIHSCFIGCADDECTEEYYYSHVQKHAVDLSIQCGPDITGCEASNECLPDDRECEVSYCDPEIDGDECKMLTNESGDQSMNIFEQNVNI